MILFALYFVLIAVYSRRVIQFAGEPNPLSAIRVATLKKKKMTGNDFVNGADKYA